MRMLDEKKEAQDTIKLLTIENESHVSRLKEWEKKIADIENMRKDIEKRKEQCISLEQTLAEKETFLQNRLADMEKEYRRKRRELEETKEKMQHEIDNLTTERKKTKNEET